MVSHPRISLGHVRLGNGDSIIKLMGRSGHIKSLRFVFLNVKLLRVITINMAQITITIANSDVDRVLDALGGYNTLIDGLPNPQTKSEFAKENIVSWLKQKVRSYESRQAVLAAAAADGTPSDIS